MLNTEYINPPIITMRDIYDRKVQKARQHCGSRALTVFVLGLFLGTATLTGLLMWSVSIPAQVSQWSDQEQRARDIFLVSQ